MKFFAINLVYNGKVPKTGCFRHLVKKNLWYSSVYVNLVVVLGPGMADDSAEFYNDYGPNWYDEK